MIRQEILVRNVTVQIGIKNMVVSSASIFYNIRHLWKVKVRIEVLKMPEHFIIFKKIVSI